MRARLDQVFGSLKVRNYRLFAIGQLFRCMGIWMLFTAQDWLVLQLTDDSGTALGVVTALQFTPVLALTLYGGKLADRFDKRKLIFMANTGAIVAAFALGLLVVSGHVQLWHVFVTATLAGVMNSIENPVRQAFVSELVPADLLPNALSLSSATFNTARIVGPAVAGLVIAAFNTGVVFMVTAAVTVGPMIAVIAMRPGDLYRKKLSRISADDARISDGLRYAFRRADLAVPIVLMLIVGMFGFNFQITLAVLAKTEFERGAESFGLLNTALAVGALAGALGSSVRRTRPSVYLVLASAVGFGLLEAVVGFAPTFTTAMLLLVPTGFFMVFLAQAANQTVQLGTAPEYRGRVMALFMLVFLGTTPIGAPLVGWWAEEFGPRSAIWGGGLISVVAALMVAAMQLRRAGGQVRVHLRPSPHLHVWEPPREDAPAVEVILPRVRAAAR